MELLERHAAYEEREKKEWLRIGWLASKIVSYLVGKNVTISDLLPEIFPEKILTREEIKKELKELRKRLKIK